MAENVPNLSFHSAADDPELGALVPIGLEGRESLSELYEYTLHLVCERDQGLSAQAVDALLANRATVGIGDASLGGVLKSVATLPTLDPQHVEYRAVLVPTVWRLSLTVRSRVFQSKTPIEIVAAVLTEHGIDHAIKTNATYPVHEYVVQYAESDLAFVCRLLEHWGVYFSFEQAPDGETLIVADRNQAFAPHPTLDTLSFSPAPSEAPGTGHVGPITRTVTPRTAAVSVGDYNWRTQYLGDDGTMRDRQLQLRYTATADAATGHGTTWRYGDHFKDEASGQTIAAVRAEQQLTGRVTIDACFHGVGLAPGHRITTAGMPIAEHDGEYVITETRIDVRTTGDAARCTQTLSAIPISVTYRPALVTPKPKIHGFMHAVIDGEVIGTTAAPIDALGRYKVILPYDVEAAPGGRASRWIRMAQPSAGASYGMHLPLHVGTEVAVYHLDGDPDRPVIAGSIPNIDTTSPVVVDNATQSRIKTRGNILFELEDDA